MAKENSIAGPGRARRLFASAFMALSVCFFLIIPNYLLYTDVPRQVDVVVLFVGPGFEYRQREACQLLADFRTASLIVPAYNLISTLAETPATGIRKITYDEYISFKARKKSFYNDLCEDTHIEALETKRLMDSLGVTSALFVSSPYHMRRIKIISDQLFDSGKYRIHYIPSRREAAGLMPWHLSLRELQWQVSESVKIAWYLLYRPFMSAT